MVKTLHKQGHSNSLSHKHTSTLWGTCDPSTTPNDQTVQPLVNANTDTSEHWQTIHALPADVGSLMQDEFDSISRSSWLSIWGIEAASRTLA
eukprot:3342482-Amphidinium_carterae.1